MNASTCIAPARPADDGCADRLAAANAEVAGLIAAARAGDDVAWQRLVDRFESSVRASVRTFRLSHADVDDVMQTTWLHLLDHIGGLREPAAISGWLKTTARRECIRLMRSAAREQLVDEPPPDAAGAHDGPESELLARERRTALARALRSLPRPQRRLMTLMALDASIDYQEISAVLTMPRGSIGPTRARSLAQLEQHTELRRLTACAN